MIILSLILMVGMLSTANGSDFTPAADEFVFQDFLINISANSTWVHYESRVFEQGLRMYGEMRLDQNVQFFIAKPIDYFAWQADHNNVSGLLYDYPNIAELDLFYRHDVTSDLYFVIWNHNDVGCQGRINVIIDRTGPEITHDVDENNYYSDVFEVDFWIDDTHFGVIGATAEILGETVFNQTLDIYNHVPQIHGSFVLDTLDEKYAAYEDLFLPVVLTGTDEGGNVNVYNLKIFIDNFPPTNNGNNGGGGGFTIFGVFTFVLLIGACATPVLGVKWVYENKYQHTKQERVDKINEEARKKKQQKKREENERTDRWEDKRSKRKRKRRNKRNGKR